MAAGRMIDGSGYGPAPGSLAAKFQAMFGGGQSAMSGGVSPLARQQFSVPSQGMSVSNIGMNPGMGANLGFGPQNHASAFGNVGYQNAMPQGQNIGQAPGGFSGGIFNGGSGNFGPTQTAHTAEQARLDKNASYGWAPNPTSGRSGGNDSNLRGHYYGK